MAALEVLLGRPIVGVVAAADLCPPQMPPGLGGPAYEMVLNLSRRLYPGMWGEAALTHYIADLSDGPPAVGRAIRDYLETWHGK